MRSAFTNTFKTFVLLAFLGALFMGIGAIFGTGGLVIGAVLALIFVGGTYWFSDKIAVAAARAKPVSREEAPRLYEIVEELRGVLAHELSHVRNRDILIGSVAAAVALMITFVARIAMFSAIFGGGDDEVGGNIIGLLAMAVLAPLAAGLLQAALSRSREYQADASGAHLIGEGEPLARALQKIEAAAKRTPMDVNPAEATAYIINPLTGRKVNFANLFSTHPPTEERIARLRNFDRTQAI